MHLCIHLYVHVYTHMQKSIYIYMYRYLCVHMYIVTSVYVYMYIHDMCICIYIYIHVYTYIYIHICIYVYKALSGGPELCHGEPPAATFGRSPGEAHQLQGLQVQGPYVPNEPTNRGQISYGTFQKSGAFRTK